MPISLINLTPDQAAIVEQPINSHIFLEGPAGCGKTTVGFERLVYLLENGIPGNQILVHTQQKKDTQNTKGLAILVSV